MPRIDPLKLLECLKVLLSPTGGIKSSTEVKRLANLMTKFSKKLVSKCIYIEILKCSDTDLLCQFMQAGGWTLVHLWLTDAINSENWPLVHEILELLLLCPVDVERLKSNTAPKLVKQLTKDEHPAEVKVLAERLVQQWLRIVRGENAPSGNTSASDVASEIEDGSQDATETEQNGNEEATVAPVQEKIVLKLSVKDGKNVIIKKNDVPKDEMDSSAGAELTAVESAESSETNTTETEDKASVSDENKTDETQEKKDEKKDKKKSSSSSKSSSSKHSSSSSHKSSSSSSSSSSSKHKSSSSSSRDKDRHKSSSSHHKSSSKSSSSKSSSSRSEKKKDKEPEMSEADKVAKTLAELEPEKLTKLGKIPKKSSSSSSDKLKPVSATATAPAVPKVKPTFSIEERDPEKRSKTVKTLNSKFRSHGLEEEAPPPPSRKVLKKPTTPTTPTLLPPPVLTSGIKRVSPPKTTISKTADPALSPPAEKKPKIEESRVNGLKKTKSHTLVETDLFSDALNMESTSRKRAIDAKKRKRRLSGSESTKTPASPTTPGIPMKFYQDTLTEEGESKAKDKDNSPEKENEKDGENKTKKLRSSTSLEDAANDEEVKKEETEVVEKRPPGIGTGPNGPPGILKVFNPNKKKRSIQWRAQEDLVEVRYFELDVEERCNVNRQFAECRQADMMFEREKILMARNLPKEDFMEAKTTWGQLIEVDGVPKHPNGEQSTERRTQAERERGVLPALWNRALLPNSPTEPDNEIHTYTEPKVIPIDDLTGNLEGVTDFSHMPWPEAKGETPTSNNNNNANLNTFAGYNNQFGGAAPFAAPNIQQPPPVSGPWATAPPALLGALGQPPPFVDPHAMNPLAAAFNIPGQFLPPGIIPPGIANNFVGPPPVNFPPTANRPPPTADRNWVRGNADRNNRGRDNWNDRDRRGGNWGDRDRGRGDSRREDRDRAIRPGVCRQFVKYGNCRQGDRCIYSHPAR